MEQIYVIQSDRYRTDGGREANGATQKDEVTYKELQQRVRSVDEGVQLKVETEGVYDARNGELIAVPIEFVNQE